MNTDNPQETLFSDFTPLKKADWIKKAVADLKGADFDKKLVWHNLNGFDLQPFYTREDRKKFLKHPGHLAKNLVNYRRISEQHEYEANARARKAVKEGMTGLVFEVKGKVHVAQLLKGIDLRNITIAFSCREDAPDLSRSLASHLASLKSKPDAVKGYLDLPHLRDSLDRGLADRGSLDDLARVINDLKAWPGIKTLNVSGTRVLDAGGSQAQEIAFTLNALVCLLDELTERGLDARFLIDRVHITLGIGSDYFTEIAKFRAFHDLLHQIANKYGSDAGQAMLTGRTSRWSKSVIDAHTNMLRATTETMSAILGNASGVEIDPFDQELGKSDEFSKRISGNIATILREESYFNKVSNPVDGSYYIETLSLKLAERALAIFKQTEERGGYLAQMNSGDLSAQIESLRSKQVQGVNSRRIGKVGVNKFPNTMESLTLEQLTRATSGQDEDAPWHPRRAGEDIEQLRLATERFVAEHDTRPVVEICSFGDPTMRRARAAFAYDFMGVGGYMVQQEKSYSDPVEAARESARSNAHITVCCSSDRDYAESALEFVKAFRFLDRNKILLLAGYPHDMRNELIKSGLDGFIHSGADICETLHDMLNRLNKNFKPTTP